MKRFLNLLQKEKTTSTSSSSRENQQTTSTSSRERPQQISLNYLQPGFQFQALILEREKKEQAKKNMEKELLLTIHESESEKVLSEKALSEAKADVAESESEKVLSETESEKAITFRELLLQKEEMEKNIIRETAQKITQNILKKAIFNVFQKEKEEAERKRIEAEEKAKSEREAEEKAMIKFVQEVTQNILKKAIFNVLQKEKEEAELAASELLKGIFSKTILKMQKKESAVLKIQETLENIENKNIRSVFIKLKTQTNQLEDKQRIAAISGFSTPTRTVITSFDSPNPTTTTYFDSPDENRPLLNTPGASSSSLFVEEPRRIISRSPEGQIDVETKHQKVRDSRSRRFALRGSSFSSHNQT